MQGMDGLLGVAGIMIHDYGSFPHSLRLAPASKPTYNYRMGPPQIWLLVYKPWNNPHELKKNISTIFSHASRYGKMSHEAWAHESWGMGPSTKMLGFFLMDMPYLYGVYRPSTCWSIDIYSFFWQLWTSWRCPTSHGTTASHLIFDFRRSHWNKPSTSGSFLWRAGTPHDQLPMSLEIPAESWHAQVCAKKNPTQS